MSWQERYQSKMNRSSWKIAHNDYHPHVDDEEDLQSHLMSHHQGDFIGDQDDHEWFHSDTSDYNVTHKLYGWPTENHDPDHYHSNDHKYVEIPNELPQSFASKEAHNFWGVESAEQIWHHLQDEHGLNIPNKDVDPKEVFEALKKQHNFMHTNKYASFNANIPNELPKSFASRASDLGIPEDEYEHWHPDNLRELELRKYDTVEALVNKFPNCDFCGKEAHYDSGTKYPEHHGAWAFTCDDCFKEHTPGKLGLGIGQRLTLGLDRFKNSMKKTADPGTLRSEGIPAFTEPSYQDDQDADDQVVGPQDLDSNATNVDKFPKSVGVFKNSFSEFGNPIDGNNNRMQSVESPGLELRYPLDSGKRNYSEQRADANPLTLRSWFTGDDVNGPWPHTKNLTGPLDFEPTDNQNEDSTGPVMSSFQSRYSHMDGVNHPWPENNNDAVEHIISHHDNIIQYNMDRRGISRETAIRTMRAYNNFQINNGERLSAIDAHIRQHKHPGIRAKYPSAHEHDDDDLGVDVPENIETIAPQYVTSSWHHSFVETFDTHPDEETPDSLLNPADELKNGRPRANDLPNQSAQLIPGMLIDHDQMGGSGTASGSF